MSILFGSNGRSVADDEFEVSTESAALIMEAVLLENVTSEELEAFVSDHSEVNASYQDEVLMERSIVRLDKNARISHAQKIAVFSIAREKKDPMFSKLLTVWRMERYLESALFKKYGNQALRVARQTVQRGSQSRSNVVKKAANRAKKQFSKPISPSVSTRLPNVAVPNNFR